MNTISSKKLFVLLSSRQGDSFELGREFFSLLSPDEKEEMNRLLNRTSMFYIYRVIEGSIERVENSGTSTGMKG